MTTDIVALVRHEPDVRTVVEGMVAFGERLELRQTEGGVSHLYDAEGRLLISIEVPVFVQVPGEIERLLGPETSEQAAVPVWWIDIRATPAFPEAVRLARKFADDIVHWRGGLVYPAARPAEQEEQP